MSNDPYILITADTHAGGSHAQYRPVYRFRRPLIGQFTVGIRYERIVRLVTHVRSVGSSIAARSLLTA